jgi:hypothetical protein
MQKRSKNLYLKKADAYISAYTKINNHYPKRRFASRITRIFQRNLQRTLFFGNNISQNKFRCPKCRKMRKFFIFGPKSWKKMSDKKWNCHLCVKKVSAVVPVDGNTTAPP